MQVPIKNSAVEVNSLLKKRILWFLVMLVSFSGSTQNLWAQTDTNTTTYKVKKSGVNDPNKQQSSNIDLDDPLSLTWKYNPKSNRYEAYKQVGSLSYPTGESLSVTEYFQQKKRREQCGLQPN